MHFKKNKSIRIRFFIYFFTNIEKNIYQNLINIYIYRLACFIINDSIPFSFVLSFSSWFQIPRNKEENREIEEKKYNK